LKPNEAFFSQGDPANAVFYLRKGRARLNVVAKSGKEATIALLSFGDFVGEAEIGNRGGSATVIPKITQQTLAEMIGTTALASVSS
jgi:CRP-like cAMP-binding protein